MCRGSGEPRKVVGGRALPFGDCNVDRPITTASSCELGVGFEV